MFAIVALEPVRSERERGSQMHVRIMIVHCLEVLDELAEALVQRVSDPTTRVMIGSQWCARPQSADPLLVTNLKNIFADPQRAILGRVVVYREHTRNRDDPKSGSYWKVRFHQMLGQPPSEFPFMKTYLLLDVQELIDDDDPERSTPLRLGWLDRHPLTVSEILSWAKKSITLNGPSGEMYYRRVKDLAEMESHLAREFRRRRLYYGSHARSSVIAGLGSAVLESLNQETVGTDAAYVQTSLHIQFPNW